MSRKRKITIGVVLSGISSLFSLPVILLLLLGGVTTAVAAGHPTPGAISGIPSTLGTKEIPHVNLVACESAAKAHDIPWPILCGINKEETDFGRSTLPGVTSGVNSAGCCAGQFQISITLWQSVGDGVPGDIYQLLPAANGAAKYLHELGLRPTTTAAEAYQIVYGYNWGPNATVEPNDGYVTRVLADANRWGKAVVAPVTGSNLGQRIANLALRFSWSNGSHGLAGRANYLRALNDYDEGGAFDGADCGSFVATVIRTLGIDSHYPVDTTTVQEAHILQTIAEGKGKYKHVPNIGNTSNLQPGDIFFFGHEAGGGGHTYIYTGPQPNHTDIAEASMRTDMPYQNVYFNYQSGDGSARIYRVLK